MALGGREEVGQGQAPFQLWDLKWVCIRPWHLLLSEEALAQRWAWSVSLKLPPTDKVTQKVTKLPHNLDS